MAFLTVYFFVYRAYDKKEHVKTDMFHMRRLEEAKNKKSLSLGSSSYKN